MAIKIKDISVLQRYGFKLKVEYTLEKYWDYDCLDNRTHVFVYEDDSIVIIGTPFWDISQKIYINQLDIIFKLIKDGHCELKELENE